MFTADCWKTAGERHALLGNTGISFSPGLKLKLILSESGVIFELR